MVQTPSVKTILVSRADRNLRLRAADGRIGKCHVLIAKTPLPSREPDAVDDRGMVELLIADDRIILRAESVSLNSPPLASNADP